MAGCPSTTTNQSPPSRPSDIQRTSSSHPFHHHLALIPNRISSWRETHRWPWAQRASPRSEVAVDLEWCVVLFSGEECFDILLTKRLNQRQDITSWDGTWTSWLRQTVKDFVTSDRPVSDATIADFRLVFVLGATWRTATQLLQLLRVICLLWDRCRYTLIATVALDHRFISAFA